MQRSFREILGSRKGKLVLGAGALSLVAALSAPALTSAASPAKAPQRPTVTVYGTAQIKVSGGAAAPENVNLNVQYQTVQASPKSAMSEAESHIKSIEAAVKSAGGTIGGQTFNIVQQGGRPVPVKAAGGTKSQPIRYRANESLRVRVTAASQMGSVISAAIGAGATGFNTYHKGYSTAATGADKAQAIAQAYQDAKTEAAAFARAQGSQLGPIASATVQQIGPYYGPNDHATVKVTYYLQ